MIDVAMTTARVAASPLSSSVHSLHHRHANAWLKTLHLHSTIAITVNTNLGWPQLGLETTVAVREGALLEDVFFFLAPISSELAERMDAAHERADRQVPLNHRMSFHLAQGKMQGEDIGGDYVGCGVGRLLNVSTPSNCGQCVLCEAYGPAQLRVKCCLGSQHSHGAAARRGVAGPTASDTGYSRWSRALCKLRGRILYVVHCLLNDLSRDAHLLVGHGNCACQCPHTERHGLATSTPADQPIPTFEAESLASLPVVFACKDVLGPKEWITIDDDDDDDTDEEEGEDIVWLDDAAIPITMSHAKRHEPLVVKVEQDDPVPRSPLSPRSRPPQQHSCPLAIELPTVLAIGAASDSPSVSIIPSPSFSEDLPNVPSPKSPSLPSIRVDEREINLGPDSLPPSLWRGSTVDETPTPMTPTYAPLAPDSADDPAAPGMRTTDAGEPEIKRSHYTTPKRPWIGSQLHTSLLAMAGIQSIGSGDGDEERYSPAVGEKRLPSAKRRCRLAINTEFMEVERLDAPCDRRDSGTRMNPVVLGDDEDASEAVMFEAVVVDLTGNESDQGNIVSIIYAGDADQVKGLLPGSGSFYKMSMLADYQKGPFQRTKMSKGWSEKHKRPSRQRSA